MVRILRTILLSGAALVAALITVEVGLRTFQPPALQYYRNVKLLHVYNAEYLVGLPANADIFVRHHAGLWEGRFTTNSLGYRASPEPDASRPQLACLGDSIVMGFGVSDEETFCRRLNNITLGGRRFQAMNLGVDAFGSMGSAKRLAEAAPRLNLKLALFFPSPNDFEMPEPLRALGQLPDDDKDALRENNRDGQLLFRLQFEATRLSYALHALKLAWEQLKIRRVETGAAILQELQSSGFTKGAGGARANPLRYFSSAFYRGGSASVCVAGKPSLSRKRDYGDPALFKSRYCPPPLVAGTRCAEGEPAGDLLPALPDVTQRAYGQMIKTAERHGIRLVVVLLPIENEVLQCTQHGRYSRHFDFALRVRRFFRKERITVLDLRPYVGRMCGEPIKDAEGVRPSSVQDYFIPADGHFTIPGNRWAAETLRTELERLRF